MKNKNFFLNDRLTEPQIETYKLFEDERLIFACREHWLLLLIRLIRTSLLGLIMAAAVGIFFTFIIGDAGLSVAAILLLLLISSMIFVRDLIHWNFHLYIATTRQIIEAHYSPILSQAVNSVLLDQIRCTEIDVTMYGIIPEFTDIGNIEITFDRPTHKEIFAIKSIRAPRQLASLLSAQTRQYFLPSEERQNRQPLWTKELKKNKYRFLGETNYGYIPN